MAACLDDLRRGAEGQQRLRLKQLFIGGEGTLGIITAAALSMVPALRRIESAFVAVPLPDAALSLFSRIMGSGAELDRLRVDRAILMEMAARHGTGLRMPCRWRRPGTSWWRSPRA